MNPEKLLLLARFLVRSLEEPEPDAQVQQAIIRSTLVEMLECGLDIPAAWHGWAADTIESLFQVTDPPPTEFKE